MPQRCYPFAVDRPKSEPRPGPFLGRGFPFPALPLGLLLLPSHTGLNKIALCIGKTFGVLAAPTKPTLGCELFAALLLRGKRGVTHFTSAPLRPFGQRHTVLRESGR
jgi:hypothetical protein